MFGPWKGVTAKRIPRSNIQRVFTGTWTWKDNLMNLGGWGIRYGRIAADASNPTKTRGWAYNPSNGPFVLIQCQDNTFYQFVTHEPETVKQTISTDIPTRLS